MSLNPEESTREEGPTDCCRELDDPIDASHDPADVSPQRERQSGGWVEVGRDVSQEVDGYDEPQRGDGRKYEDGLPRLEHMPAVANENCRAAREDECETSHPEELGQQPSQSVIGVRPVCVASLTTNGCNEGGLSNRLLHLRIPSQCSCHLSALLRGRSEVRRST